LLSQTGGGAFQQIFAHLSPKLDALAYYFLGIFSQGAFVTIFHMFFVYRAAFCHMFRRCDTGGGEVDRRRNRRNFGATRGRNRSNRRYERRTEDQSVEKSHGGSMVDRNGARGASFDSEVSLWELSQGCQLGTTRLYRNCNNFRRQ
jgi:hypothetical protein